LNQKKYSNSASLGCPECLSQGKARGSNVN
jgi:hypothetical protein